MVYFAERDIPLVL